MSTSPTTVLDELRSWLERPGTPTSPSESGGPGSPGQGGRNPTGRPTGSGGASPEPMPTASPGPSGSTARSRARSGPRPGSSGRPSWSTAPTTRSGVTCGAWSRAPTPTASCSASRTPAPTSPACRPGPSVTATTGWSTGRRCGHPVVRSPTRPCSSPAPTWTCQSTPGISYFIIDVTQPGVEIRPLREMTGRAFFNEVFLTDARVPAEDLIGGEGNGWAVANTTLAFERSQSGGGEAGATADPGPSPATSTAGRDFAPARDPRRLEGPERAVGHPGAGPPARAGRRPGDPQRPDAPLRPGAPRTASTAGGAALELSGRQLAGLPNLAKMAQSHAYRLGRDLTFAILGAAGTLHDFDRGGTTRLDTRARDRWARRPGGGGPVRPGSADLRRIGPDSAQHRRGPGARPGPGAERRQGRAVPGPVEN